MPKCKSFSHYLIVKYFSTPTRPKLQTGKKKIACIGDSITYGAGVRGKTELTWEYFLEQQLGKDWQVLNYGFSGRTVLSSSDYPYTREKLYAMSQKAQADVYMIMLGTNDSKPYNWDEPRFREEMGSFVDSYCGLENRPVVLLMAPPCAFPDPVTGIVGFDTGEETVGHQIRTIVQETAKERSLPFVDMYAFTENHPEWFADGVHPNEAGNRAFADYLAKQLSRLIADI